MRKKSMPLKTILKDSNVIKYYTHEMALTFYICDADSVNLYRAYLYAQMEYIKSLVVQTYIHRFQVRPNVSSRLTMSQLIETLYPVFS